MRVETGFFHASLDFGGPPRPHASYREHSCSRVVHCRSAATSRSRRNTRECFRAARATCPSESAGRERAASPISLRNVRRRGPDTLARRCASPHVALSLHSTCAHSRSRASSHRGSDCGSALPTQAVRRPRSISARDPGHTAAGQLTSRAPGGAYRESHARARRSRRCWALGVAAEATWLRLVRSHRDGGVSRGTTNAAAFFVK